MQQSLNPFLQNMEIDSPVYWLTISCESREMEARCLEAIAGCWMVHLWTLERLQECWQRTMQIPRSSELGPLLTNYLNKSEDMESYNEVKRYAFDVTVEKTISYFMRTLHVEQVNIWEDADTGIGKIPEKVGEETRVIFPEPIAADRWNQFYIRSRKTWQTYMPVQGRLSTAYGTFYLENNPQLEKDWSSELEWIAEQLGVAPRYLPVLAHSITVAHFEDNPREWRAKFNFHKPGSSFGKQKLQTLKRLERLERLERAERAERGRKGQKGQKTSQNITEMEENFSN
jgi:hypothetical protein